jgi:hypothetical protein
MQQLDRVIRCNLDKKDLTIINEAIVHYILE